jgi:hypothetical protein
MSPKTYIQLHGGMLPKTKPLEEPFWDTDCVTLFNPQVAIELVRTFFGLSSATNEYPTDVCPERESTG